MILMRSNRRGIGDTLSEFSKGSRSDFLFFYLLASAGPYRGFPFTHPWSPLSFEISASSDILMIWKSCLPVEDVLPDVTFLSSQLTRFVPGGPAQIPSLSVALVWCEAVEQTVVQFFFRRGGGRLHSFPSLLFCNLLGVLSLQHNPLVFFYSL